VAGDRRNGLDHLQRVKDRQLVTRKRPPILAAHRSNAFSAAYLISPRRVGALAGAETVMVTCCPHLAGAPYA
jgi:hypothetical protein